MSARWLKFAAVLGVAVAVTLLIFRAEGRAAVQTWIDSTAYGHCFFVVPIALFLGWERRAVIAAMPIRPLPWVGVAVLPVGAVWLFAERVGIMEGQQLMVFTAVQVLAFAGLGWTMYRAMSVPLLYLVFLVPFGAFITPALQSFTAHFIDVGLDVLGIVHFSDGNVVEITAGKFFVAEACAGLRFLIASIAFGVLYACMIYRSPWRRAAFIVASLIIPVVANGFRALGIVTLGEILGSTEAAAVDHVLYGWIFFSIVILVLIAAGLPFRQDDLTPPVPAAQPDAPRAVPRMAWAAVLVVGLMGVAPAWVALIDRDQGAAMAALEPGAVIGCLPQQMSAAERGHSWRYLCPISAGSIDHLDLRVDALPAHSNAGALNRKRRDITLEAAAEEVDVQTMEETPIVIWQRVSTGDPDHLTMVAAWVDGHPARGGFKQRLERARNSLLGNTPAPLLISISTPAEVQHFSESQLNQVQQAMRGLIVRNRGFVADLAHGTTASP